jgi:hypothetical protein
MAAAVRVYQPVKRAERPPVRTLIAMTSQTLRGRRVVQAPRRTLDREYRPLTIELGKERHAVGEPKLGAGGDERGFFAGVAPLTIALFRPAPRRGCRRGRIRRGVTG